MGSEMCIRDRNKGTPVRVTGGDLTQAAGNLYLLSAEQEDVYIEFE